MANTPLDESLPTTLGRDESLMLKCKLGDAVDCSKCGPCATDIKEQGDMLLSSGNFEAAIEKYKESWALNSESPDALNNWANALGHLGRHEEALTKIKQALEIDPTYGYALYTAAVILNHLDRQADAIGACNCILDLYNADDVREFRDSIIKERYFASTDIVNDYSSVSDCLTEEYDFIYDAFAQADYIDVEAKVEYPELYSKFVPLFSSLFPSLLKSYEENNLPMQNFIPVLGRFSFMYGAAAAYCMDHKREALESASLFDMMNVRGFDVADEYMADLIGLQWGSEFSNTFAGQLEQMSAIVASHYLMKYDIVHGDRAKIQGAVFRAMGREMFTMGMVYQNDRKNKNL